MYVHINLLRGETYEGERDTDNEMIAFSAPPVARLVHPRRLRPRLVLLVSRPRRLAKTLPRRLVTGYVHEKKKR